MYIKHFTVGYFVSRGIPLLIMLLFVFSSGFSQSTIVKGKVVDQDTGQPIPYISVVFKNTQIGELTDTLGHFRIITKEKADSINLSSVGYFSKTIGIKPATTNELTIMLKSVLIPISEIKVKPSDELERRILKKMIEHKNSNNPSKYARYSYRKYSKWEYHLRNVSDKMYNSKAFRNDHSVFRKDSDSTRYLPIYFSEQLVFNEFQRNPSRQKSTVLADKTSGVGVLDEYEIAGYTSALDIEVNFYDNFVNLFTQNFASPLNDNGWFYYKYFLVDSLVHNGRKEYRIDFTPRRVGDKVFKGYMITENKNYSLLEVDGTLSNTSSLNFLESLSLKSNYQLVSDSIPFFRRNQIDAVFNYIPLKFNPAKKPISLFYTQSSIIDSVKVNQADEVKLTNGGGKYETIKLPGATERNNKYWQSHRMEEFNLRENEITTTIDSVNQIGKVKFVDNLVRMVMTGYYDLGKWEFGPYPNTLNISKVEGLHLFAGARTSSEISTKYMVWGGLGYGFRNKMVNGIAGFGYKFQTIRRQLTLISFDDKIVRTGESEKILFLYENALSPTENNLISQVFQRTELNELFREQRLAISYEYEWHPGLLNKMNFHYTRHFSPEFYPFLRAGSPVSQVSSIDFNIDTRLSWKEKLIDDKFLRVYLTTIYPIFHLTVGVGKVFYSGKQNYYGELFGTMAQNVMIGQTGLNYAIEGGMYLGKLPYTMLDIPRGNETYGFFSYDFNLLNYLEFVHDKYLHVYLEYHLNGFVFNRLPLLKKLGLREVFSAKSMIGSLSDKHQQIVEYPNGVTKMTNPYLEVGAGIENIFRLCRVEAIWRVMPKSVINAPTFGIRAKFEIIL